MARATSFRSASPLHRLVRRVTWSAAGSRVMAPVLHRADRVVLRATRGRHSASSLASGLPIVVLTTTGARSGQSRTTPLVGLPTSGGIAVIASSFGRARHPGWYHNLLARPRGTVAVRGVETEVTAEVLAGEQRESVWRQGLDLYPGWAVYDVRSGAREIPVVLLRPVDR